MKKMPIVPLLTSKYANSRCFYFTMSTERMHVRDISVSSTLFFQNFMLPFPSYPSPDLRFMICYEFPRCFYDVGVLSLPPYLTFVVEENKIPSFIITLVHERTYFHTRAAPSPIYITQHNLVHSYYSSRSDHPILVRSSGGGHLSRAVF